MGVLIVAPLVGAFVKAQTLASVLIAGGLVVDGSGSKPVVADVRIAGDRVVAVGNLRRAPGERVIDATGRIVAPGFIDSHSHADAGIAEHPDAESQLRQGITTAVCGQDGGRAKPVAERLAEIGRLSPALNFAFFSGHGGLRNAVMGKDSRRPATSEEIARMAVMLEEDMKAGALGLSTGLEYDPGHYAETSELVELAKIAAKHRGIYISHVRDETNGVFDSFREVVRIAREAGLPAQISHIKLAVAGVWGQSAEALGIIDEARRSGIDVTADVYPYLFWQSTITVLTTSREWGDRRVWEDGLADVGGPRFIRLTTFTPDRSWEGKTLEELERLTGKDAVALIMEIIERTRDGRGQESIICAAMQETDLVEFMRHPHVMFCSDGLIGGSHPRGAGSFPRIVGRYAREGGPLPLPEAIRKMTALPASRFGLRDRGAIKKGMIADIVIFDRRKFVDRSTPSNPRAMATGIDHLFVNGVAVIDSGKLTRSRPGRAVRGSRR